MKTIRLAALVAFLGLSASCMTTYDAYGSPVQSVDPGVALMGVAAAGLIGYALSDDNDYHSYGSGGYTSYQGNHYGGNSGYYGGGGYSRGYSNCY